MGTPKVAHSHSKGRANPSQPVVDQPSSRFDQLTAAAQALNCDRITAEVVSAMEPAGIPTILMKGPSIARWLYPTGGRTYSDSDLLVPHTEFDRAKAVLVELGFRDRYEWWDPFERSINTFLQVETPFIRSSEIGLGPSGFVDLHRNLPRLPTPHHLLWDVFSAHTETMSVAGVEVRVLDRPALGLHIVIHAVQHGFDAHTSEDLVRLLEAVAFDEWRDVAELAEQLGIANALGSGLRHFPLGSEIADCIDLPSLSSADFRIWRHHAPRGSLSLHEFSSAPTLRMKVRWVRWILFPSQARIRALAERTDVSTSLLAVLYLRRAYSILAAMLPALRSVRRRRRFVRVHGEAS